MRLGTRRAHSLASRVHSEKNTIVNQKHYYGPLLIIAITPVSSIYLIRSYRFLAWVMNIVNVILHSHQVTDEIQEDSDVSDKDFNSTNEGWDD